VNTQHIDLDISKSPTMPQHVRIGQGDSAGTTIVATIYDNGVAATLTGMSARFCMRLPGGMQYVRDSGCTVSGSNVTYVVDEEHCAAVKGRTDEAYFELLASGSVVYSTNRFTVQVLRGVTDGAVPGEPYDTEIERAINRANEAAEAAEEAAGGVTPLMSDSTRGGAKLGDGLSVDANEKLNVDPLTTTQIDSIVADTAVTSPKVLNGTRLTYLWGKLKAAFSKASSIASVESATATASHAKDSHFMLNGVLRKATSAIAAGESITNSNSTTDTVQGQIDTLRNSLGRWNNGNLSKMTLYRNPDNGAIEIHFYESDGSHSYLALNNTSIVHGRYDASTQNWTTYWTK